MSVYLIYDIQIFICWTNFSIFPLTDTLANEGKDDKKPGSEAPIPSATYRPHPKDKKTKGIIIQTPVTLNVMNTVHKL